MSPTVRIFLALALLTAYVGIMVFIAWRRVRRADARRSAQDLARRIVEGRWVPPRLLAAARIDFPEAFPPAGPRPRPRLTSIPGGRR